MNKKTGKTFIHVLEKNSEEALMVTPEGALKVLENKLFTEPLEIEDERKLLARGDINRDQFDTFRKHAQGQSSCTPGRPSELYFIKVSPSTKYLQQTER